MIIVIPQCLVSHGKRWSKVAHTVSINGAAPKVSTEAFLLLERARQQSAGRFDRAKNLFYTLLGPIPPPENANREQSFRPIPREPCLLHARAAAPQAPQAHGGAMRRTASLRDRVAAARAPDAGLRSHVPRLGHHLRAAQPRPAVGQALPEEVSLLFAAGSQNDEVLTRELALEDGSGLWMGTMILQLPTSIL